MKCNFCYLVDNLTKTDTISDLALTLMSETIKNGKYLDCIAIDTCAYLIDEEINRRESLK